MTKREEVVALIINAKCVTKELMNEAYFQIYGDRWTTKTLMSPDEFTSKWDRYQHLLANHCYEQAALSVLPINEYMDGIREKVHFGIRYTDDKYTVMIGSGRVVVASHSDLTCAILLGTLSYLDASTMRHV